MNDDLINRGDAIAIAMHSKDPVEGIKNLPAADAVEVVHAKWGKMHYDAEFDEYTRPCSNCGYHSLEYVKLYCPNCGARMDGE